MKVDYTKLGRKLTMYTIVILIITIHTNIVHAKRTVGLLTLHNETTEKILVGDKSKVYFLGSLPSSVINRFFCNGTKY